MSTLYKLKVITKIGIDLYLFPVYNEITKKKYKKVFLKEKVLNKFIQKGEGSAKNVS